MRTALLLQEMFQRMSVKQFVERCFQQVPYADLGPLTTVMEWGTLERFYDLLIDPRADVLIGRDGRRWAGDKPQTRSDCEAVLEAGYTLGLRHLDRIDAQAAGWASAFEHAFGSPADVHLYGTPPGQTGFGWHYDAEDVFVLQAQGDKEWRLRKNTVHPWPLIDAIPADQHSEQEMMPVVSCRLPAGHWLSIPAGYWHQTQAGQFSLSLSIGLRSWTALDVFDSARRQLEADLLWRQRLAPQTDPEGQRVNFEAVWDQLLPALVADLTNRLTGPAFREEFRRWQISLLRPTVETSAN